MCSNRCLVFVSLLALASCDDGGDEAPATDAAEQDAAEQDAAEQDSAVQDAAAQDSGEPDAALADAALPDARQDSGEPPIDPEPIFAEVRAAIDSSSLPEGTVLMGDAAGILFSHSKGEATPTTAYPIASASKWLTSLTVMRMVKAGLLSLDDRPQDHLDWWIDDPEDPRSHMSLAQLLSFTSGLNGGTGLGGDPGVPCIEEADTTLDACAREIYAENFAFAPGTSFFYGPTHMHIVATMTEAATGGTWHEAFERHLGTPVGTSRATGYRYPSRENPRASGGATSTAEDYGKVLQALLAGELLDEEARAALIRQRTSELSIEGIPDVARDGRAWQYALGCWRECEGEAYTEACEAAGLASSPGAFGFYPWVDFARGYWGVLATRVLRGPNLTVPLGQAWYTAAIPALDAAR